jgi:hypothetical protein
MTHWNGEYAGAQYPPQFDPTHLAALIPTGMEAPAVPEEPYLPDVAVVIFGDPEDPITRPPRYNISVPLCLIIEGSVASQQPLEKITITVGGA